MGAASARRNKNVSNILLHSRWSWWHSEHSQTYAHTATRRSCAAFMMEMDGKRNDTQQSRASEKIKQTRNNFRNVCGTGGKKKTMLEWVCSSEQVFWISHLYSAVRLMCTIAVYVLPLSGCRCKKLRPSACSAHSTYFHIIIVLAIFLWNEFTRRNKNKQKHIVSLEWKERQRTEMRRTRERECERDGGRQSTYITYG